MLNNYDATMIDNVSGVGSGDSYLAQEWSYANSNKAREDFISLVCSKVSFVYPQEPQLSTKGKQMINKDGSNVMKSSSMNNGESIKVTHIDYNALSEEIKSDKENIIKMYNEAGITSKDYEFSDKVTDLMCQYITSKQDLPITTSEITLGVELGSNPIISDDSALDKLLFSSDEFHNMCDVFSQVATSFTGFKKEKYKEKEEQPNPEYAQWKMKLMLIIRQIKVSLRKVSREPWYLRDDNNNFILDEKV